MRLLKTSIPSWTITPSVWFLTIIVLRRLPRVRKCYCLAYSVCQSEFPTLLVAGKKLRSKLLFLSFPISRVIPRFGRRSNASGSFSDGGGGIFTSTLFHFTFTFLFPVMKEGASSHYRSPIITSIFSTLWHIHFHFLNYVVFFDTSSAVYLLLNIAGKGIEYLTRPFIDVHCTHTSHSSWLIVHIHNSTVSLLAGFTTYLSQKSSLT